MNNLRLIFIGVLGSIFCETINVKAQNSIANNEKIILSFATKGDKNVFLIKDTADKYMVCKIFNQNGPELTYPKALDNSWKLFTYSYYLRGGGKQNEGLDLNYLYFTCQNKKYVLYETYSAVEDSTRFGLRIIDLNSQESIDDAADLKTVNGSLLFFRNSEKVLSGEEQFD